MRVIWKYAFQVIGGFTLHMPRGAEIIALQPQGSDPGIPCIWALVDQNEPTQERHFVIRGTGNGVPESYAHRYVGTFQLMEGRFVGHVFEVT